MSGETLRDVIKEKQRPQCKGEPAENAIANYLAAFQWQILTDDVLEQEIIMQQLGYNNIESLRADTIALKKLLRKNMDPDDWLGYFHE